MVNAEQLGRKTGWGWYTYDKAQPHRPEDPKAPEQGDPATVSQSVLISGFLPIADELRARAEDAGFAVTDAPDGNVCPG